MATIECICPSTPDGQTRHPDGDTVTLRPALDFRSALTVRNAIALLADEPGIGDADILAALTERYLFCGIESWTLVDERGKPLPVTRANILDRLLSRPMVAMTVGDEADGLYTEAVVLPLLARRSTSSPGSPTADTTSVPSGSSMSPRTRRSPSSTTSTPTDGIETISALPAGDFNSSPN